MRVYLLVLTFAVSSTVALAAQSNGAEPPDRATIEKLEATIAFWKEVESIGAAGVIATKGRGWRVKIRSLDCRLIEGQAHCSYETRPCFHPPLGKEDLGWCMRERRFRPGEGFHAINGWEEVPADLND